LGLLFRVAVIGGARRGELCGFRWAGADLDAGYLKVTVPVYKLGGKTHEEERGAKTRAGRNRRIWLDAETIRLLREHRERHYWHRLTMGDAWTDKDLIFAQADGSPHNPDRVYRRFKRLAAEAGVPVIKLHEGGRHTQASLANDAGIDAEIRRKTLGHSDAAMTSHYTHIQAEANRAAAEALAALVDGSES
jgi:integrase